MFVSWLAGRVGTLSRATAGRETVSVLLSEAWGVGKAVIGKAAETGRALLGMASQRIGLWYESVSRQTDVTDTKSGTVV